MKGFSKRIPKRRIMRGKNFVRCHYCGKRLTAKTVTRDHVRAHSKGGYGRMKNLVACCSPCNSAKGSMSKGEFMERMRSAASVTTAERPTRKRMT